ncbi:MAG: phosphopantothenoylcysteine decarboxylase [Candidatus Altiarchaeota archaeon]
MRVLITAGPTREYIDDIRFISNESTGLMGLALAEEAYRRGFEVTLVLGPTSLPTMYGVRVIPVVSSEEMTERTLAELGNGYDILISAAALADYTPFKKVGGKIRSGGKLTLKLKPTRKLIVEARKCFPDLKIVAFKAEYGGSVDEMVGEAKKLMPCADMVILNDVSRNVFGCHETEAYILCDGVKCLPRMPKKEAAKKILDSIGGLLTG